MVPAMISRTGLNLGGTGPEVAMLIFYEMVVSYYDNASLVSFVVLLTLSLLIFDEDFD